PLARVSETITPVLLRETIELLHKELSKKFHLANPKIVVCGLNPHAGEGGYLGREEIETITPVIQALTNQHLNITGPIPADTAFLSQVVSDADVILAMYHDQALPVVKQMGFDRAVNVTLGLPYIRTSVDHGTALSLAGSGKANPASMQA